MIPVKWNDTEYDLDLTEYVGLELNELEQRTGVTWRRTFVGLLTLTPDSIRAPFWLTDRRGNPDLKWSEYGGPPVVLVMPHLAEVRSVVEALGKLMLVAQPEQETNGSPGSPSDVDTPPPSSTP